MTFFRKHLFLIVFLLSISYFPFSAPSAHADITTGLVGYWTFNEGSGTTAADSSGNGNNGILNNGPTWTTGKISGGLSFDGVNDYVVTPEFNSATSRHIWTYC